MMAEKTKPVDDESKANLVKLEICPTKLSSKCDKKYQKKTYANIIKAIDGLYNSDGGTLMLCYNRFPPPGHTRKCVRMLEQKIQDFLGTITLTFDINVIKIPPSSSQAHGEIKIIVKTFMKTKEIVALSNNIYLPSNEQVMEVLPSESVEKLRAILMENIPSVDPIEPGSHHNNFVKDKVVSFSESVTTQFKKLKDTPSPTKKCTLTTRLVGKGNKFPCYVSAFANYAGGHMYIGINDEGKVEGEYISKEEMKKVKEKIGAVIKKMIWPQKSEPADGKKDKRWDVHFEPVRDDRNKVIPRTYVVVVFVAQCRGGVFTEGPECYEIIDNQVHKVDFASWKKRIDPRLTKEGTCCTSQSGSSNDPNPQDTNMDTTQPPNTSSSTSPSRSHRNGQTHSNRQSPSDGHGTDRPRETNAVVNLMLQNTGHRDQLLPCQSFHFASLVPKHGQSAPVRAQIPDPEGQTGDRPPENPISGTCCAHAPSDLVYEKLTNLLNNNCNREELDAASKSAEENYEFSDVKLTCLSKFVSFNLRRGDYPKAEKCLKEYTEILPSSTNRVHFEVMEQYLYSIMERCKGHYYESDEIAKKSLDDLKKLPHCIISAAFYIQIATMENILAMKTKDRKERLYLRNKAEDNYNTASSHLNQIRGHSTTKAEYQQKIHINKALLHLGCCLTGDMLHDSEELIDIKKAKHCLLKTQQIILESYPLSKFRKIQNLFAQACLFYRLGNDDPSRRSEVLNHAVNYSEKAKRLAEKCKFVEMKKYAENFIKFFESKTWLNEEI